MRQTAGITLFCVCFTVGHLLTVNAWNATVFLYLGEERSPAAIRSVSEFAPLSYHVLRLNPSAQLLRPARVEVAGDSVGIHLGNPLFRGRTAEFACRIPGRPGRFDRVELTFLGSGVAVSGEVPSVTVEASCAATHTASELNTIWIPSGKFAGAAHARPEQWVLTGVRLFNSSAPSVDWNLGPGELRAEKRPVVVSQF